MATFSHSFNSLIQWFHVPWDGWWDLQQILSYQRMKQPWGSSSVYFSFIRYVQSKTYYSIQAWITEKNPTQNCKLMLCTVRLCCDYLLLLCPNISLCCEKTCGYAYGGFSEDIRGKLLGVIFLCLPWIPGIKLRLSGMLRKHLYLLSHIPLDRFLIYLFM